MAIATEGGRLTTEGGSTCPVCGAQAVARIDLSDFRLLRCPRCGCWSSDALARGATTSFEPESYFENAELDRDKWDALFDRIGTRREIRSVLDVGCGTGAYLRYLRQTLPPMRRVGIELDPERAATALAGDPQASIHEGDALEALGEIDGEFDLITLWDVFEHVPAPARLLRALGERLSAGGLLYLQTIHERSCIPTLGRLSYQLSGGRVVFAARRTHEPHHLVFFTRRGLERAADAADLRIRELWFDRLHRGRMDGAALLTTLTSVLLRAENALGGGLFVNLLLERAAPASDGAHGGQ